MGCFSKPKKDVRLGVSQFVLQTQNVILINDEPDPGGGVPPSHTLPIRVCAAQWGRDFEALDLERGIHFRGVF